MIVKQLWVIFCALVFVAFGYAQDAAALHEKGKTFMRNRDYENAVIVLQQAFSLAPENIEIGKDLSLNYYFIGENEKALKTIQPILDNAAADDICFKIAGDIYIIKEDLKGAEKLYRRSVKKIANSGLLYNELGKILWQKKDYEAIKYWEKGIEVAPNFSKNYFFAAKYYYLTTDKIWSIVYGETFLNMEPNGNNTPEMKKILLDSYKKLFLTGLTLDKANENVEFCKAFMNTIKKYQQTMNTGVTVENLAALRTFFATEWYANYNNSFPLKTIEWHKQMLEEGMFEVYNNWIFASADDLMRYQTWTQNNKELYMQFLRFQQNRIFKVPEGQNYKF